MYYPFLLCKHRPLTLALWRKQWRNGGENGTVGLAKLDWVSWLKYTIYRNRLL